MPLTPRIRHFLVQVEELIDTTDSPGLDRDRVEITTADAVALVRLPHRTGDEHDPENHDPEYQDVEIQVDDHKVVVSYGGEPVHLRDREFALKFVEALLAGRVDIEVYRGVLWRTTASYLDSSARPFLVTRMPVPAPIAPREGRRVRRRVGFGPPDQNGA
jgi:hypothetical protein